MLRGLAAFRWLAWLWMATVLYLARRALDRPVLAVALVAAALVVTVWLTSLLTRDTHRLLGRPAVGVEVGVALALQLADGFVYRAGHVFSGEQPLGVAWPIAGVLAAGIAFGPAVGGLVGLAMGLGRAVSSVLNVVPDPAQVWLGSLTAVEVLSLVTTSVMYALAGGVGGYAYRLVRAAEARITTAERQVAEAHAREEVARRLHDGVLQTLAVVERRADDPQLARLARDQERELRDYLFGADRGAVGHGTLGTRLREAAGRFESAFGGRAEVLVPDDLPELSEAGLEALVGAVGEALTNAGKHGRAARVIVYVEPDEGGVTCSVRDDGEGFDPGAVTEGVGLSRSVRGRVAEVGGDVEVHSAPGRGTELRVRLPAG